MNLPILAAAFFVVAAIYSSAGFGGGTAYLAIMSLAGLNHQEMPITALLCNTVVVASGSPHFIHAGHLRRDLLFPFLIGSAPFALLGGRLSIGESLFSALLGVSLMTAALLLFHSPAGGAAGENLRPAPPVALRVIAGAALGLLSGMVGIGGGIFLSPLLLHFRWATPRQSAACASVFILINSLTGLAGQWMKSGPVWRMDLAWLAAAVLVGGQLGSVLAVRTLPQLWIRRVTGAIVLTASIKLLSNALSA
ncbi:MAG: hypothetical protein GMKNLPBB_01883 [Myxococcota bacterium]|nr:hypothetical protein [Myxococcota bacterium]